MAKLKGKFIADNQINTDHMIDGSITNAKIADSTIAGSKLSSDAKQSILESKLATSRVAVTGFSVSNASSDVVTTEVVAAATVSDPIGQVSNSLDAKGVYAGTVSGAGDIKRVQIRVAGTDEGLPDGNDNEVYGVLSESENVWTLSFFKSNGSAHTMAGTETIDFYFVEVFDMFSMPVESGLNTPVAGVVDATTASAITNHKEQATAAHAASAVSFDSSGLDNTTAENLQSAISDVDGAVSSAQADATQALSDAATADGKAVDAQADATQALSDAATADGKAVDAQADATQALADAATADGKAVDAQADATQALADAATADGKAVDAQADATQALADAATAQATADAAQPALQAGDITNEMLESDVVTSRSISSLGYIFDVNGSTPITDFGMMKPHNDALGSWTVDDLELQHSTATSPPQMIPYRDEIRAAFTAGRTLKIVDNSLNVWLVSMKSGSVATDAVAYGLNSVTGTMSLFLINDHFNITNNGISSFGFSLFVAGPPSLPNRNPDGIVYGDLVSGLIQSGADGFVNISLLPIIDEDNMYSDSNTLIPTQQSVKAYVDAEAGAAQSAADAAQADATQALSDAATADGKAVAAQATADAAQPALQAGDITDAMLESGVTSTGEAGSAGAYIEQTGGVEDLEMMYHEDPMSLRYYAQLFTATSDDTLEKVILSLKNDSANNIDAKVSIYAYDDMSPDGIGSWLQNSGLVSVTSDSYSDVEFTLQSGGVSLTLGDSYWIVVSHETTVDGAALYMEYDSSAVYGNLIESEDMGSSWTDNTDGTINFKLLTTAFPGGTPSTTANKIVKTGADGFIDESLIPSTDAIEAAQADATQALSDAADNASAISDLEAVSHAQKKEILTLSAGDISAKYKDLVGAAAGVADISTVRVVPVGGIEQEYTVDFTVIVDGGAVLRRINWNGLGLDGVLAEEDKIQVFFEI